MSTEITTAFVKQFEGNWMHLSQQQESRLVQAVHKLPPIVGVEHFVDRVGATAAVKKTTRHGDTPLISTPHSRRKLSLETYEWADLIDKEDKVALLVDPTSDYALAGSMAMNRSKDDVIIAALGATVYTGQTGATSVNNYAAGECRIVQGDGTVATAGSDASDTTETGLTLTKLFTCKELLDGAEVDPDRQRFFVTNAHNLNALLNTTEVKSADYNTVKALAKGEIDTFMGFKFIQSERLATHGTDTACIRSYAFAGDAIALGMGAEVITRVTERADKSYSVQVYLAMTLGAVRREGPAVVEILLDAA